MLSPKIIALLEDYVAGRLTAEAKKELYSLLGGKPEKNEEAKVYIDIYTGLNGLELDDLRADMAMWEKKYTSEDTQPTEIKKVVLLSSYRKYVAAAAIVLLSVAAYWTTQTTNTSQSLFADNFSVDHVMLLSANRGGNNGGENSKELAFVLLQSKRFSEATKSFKTILEESAEDKAQGGVLLGLSIALMGEGRYDEAYDSLLNLDTMSIESFQEYTDWYLALVCLKLDKLENARRLFNGIRENSNHIFNREAVDVLSKF